MVNRAAMELMCDNKAFDYNDYQVQASDEDQMSFGRSSWADLTMDDVGQT